ncbi:hypothetical protein PA598K_05298 [Paenibacillus sp. 598K]|uniref:hypothetical protein n=1 Tax=Paenibacillus sp. 598K TaxID=1117987 RepID=UPI000FF98666|nr:hypothetical protein [Paenibacillus sp. 598K]GBF76806.1 hypothetical protein PA598K_05298 [Paenibacillus sp. 598K]
MISDYSCLRVFLLDFFALHRSPFGCGEEQLELGSAPYYEERQKYLHDEASMIEWATEKGMVAGEQKKAIQIAKNMLELGLEVEVVAKASGLSKAEVESLKPVN